MGKIKINQMIFLISILDISRYLRFKDPEQLLSTTIARATLEIHLRSRRVPVIRERMKISLKTSLDASNREGFSRSETQVLSEAAICGGGMMARRPKKQRSKMIPTMSCEWESIGTICSDVLTIKQSTARSRLTSPAQQQQQKTHVLIWTATFKTSSVHREAGFDLFAGSC
jgi:hypothetical protein